VRSDDGLQDYRITGLQDDGRWMMFFIVGSSPCSLLSASLQRPRWFGSKFKVQGSRFKVLGSRFKVQGGSRAASSRFKVQGGSPYFEL
jgi:hypothetical protein